MTTLSSVSVALILTVLPPPFPEASTPLADESDPDTSADPTATSAAPTFPPALAAASLIKSFHRVLCASDLNLMILEALATDAVRSEEWSGATPMEESALEVSGSFSAALIAADASSIFPAPSHTQIAFDCPAAARLENRMAPAPRPDSGVAGHTCLPLPSKSNSELLCASTRTKQGIHRRRPNETLSTLTLAATTRPALATSTDPASLKMSDPVMLASSS